MIIDCRKWSSDPDRMAREQSRVFVDGVEIKQVWYVDTDAGFVCSYDVLGDGKAHATRERIDPEVIIAARAKEVEPWDMPENGAMSKTVRGQVELRPFAATEDAA